MPEKKKILISLSAERCEDLGYFVGRYPNVGQSDIISAMLWAHREYERNIVREPGTDEILDDSNQFGVDELLDMSLSSR